MDDQTNSRETIWPAFLLVLALLLLLAFTAYYIRQQSALRRERQRWAELTRQRQDAYSGAVTPQIHGPYPRATVIHPPGEFAAEKAAFEKENAELIAAYDYYHRPDRDRQKAADLFEAYLDHHPDSPFRGEIYFRIGARYTIYAHENETRSMETAEQWYLKALPCFDGKYDSVSVTTWITLCNYPIHNHDIAYKKQCYDWLKRLAESGTAEDVYPYWSISHYLSNRELGISQADRESIMEHQRQQIADTSMSVERANIFQRASVSDLKDLAASYPDDPLGREAAQRLAALEEARNQKQDEAALTERIHAELRARRDAQISTDSLK